MSLTYGVGGIGTTLAVVGACECYSRIGLPLDSQLTLDD